MVDGIVANLLSYDIKFENGVTPNLFKRHWTERLNPVSAVYNYPGRFRDYLCIVAYNYYLTLTAFCH